MEIAIVILAAGSSSRMGKAKQLLPWGELTLIEHSIRQAILVKSASVYVVLGALRKSIEQSILTSPVKIIHNPVWENGIGSSISVVMDELITQKFDAVLLMLADQPEVDTDYLNKMIYNFKNSPKDIVATAYSSKNGVPAMFHQTYFSALQKLNIDSGAAQIIKLNNEATLSLKPKKYFTDIDTIETYKALHKSFFSDDKYTK